jgi:hypothetical protein
MPERFGWSQIQDGSHTKVTKVTEEMLKLCGPNGFPTSFYIKISNNLRDLRDLGVSLLSAAFQRTDSCCPAS